MKTLKKYYKSRDLAIEAQEFKNKLFEAGLYRTAHKMDEVTKEIGYEISEMESLTVNDLCKLPGRFSFGEETEKGENTIYSENRRKIES